MIQEIIDGKQVIKCSKCGEEIMSMLHRCNPFIDIDFNDSQSIVKEKLE